MLITLNDIIELIKPLRWYRFANNPDFVVDFARYRAELGMPSTPYVPWGSLKRGEQPPVTLTIWDCAEDKVVYEFKADERLDELWLYVYKKTGDKPLEVRTNLQKFFVYYVENGLGRRMNGTNM